MKKRIMTLMSLIPLLFFGCSDWTVPEAVDIESVDVEIQSPEIYARYLENLRAYKEKPHKITYSWFNNDTEVAISQADNLTTIPDSVDVVVLMKPDSLGGRLIAEMEKVQKDKATKFIYSIQYSKAESAYDAYVEQSKEKSAEKSVKSLADFLPTYVQEQLAIFSKYPYDGIAVNYTGKAVDHLTPVEIAEYQANQNAFFVNIKKWIVDNKDAMFVYEGSPEFLLDKKMLSSVDYIVLMTLNATSGNALTFDVLKTLVTGVPTNRFIVAVQTTSLDPLDVKTGYFFGADGEKVKASIEAAYWVTEANDQFKKAGIGIYNIQNDYYDKSMIYQATRKAISIMNPSPEIVD